VGSVPRDRFREIGSAHQALQRARVSSPPLPVLLGCQSISYPSRRPRTMTVRSTLAAGATLCHVCCLPLSNTSFIFVDSRSQSSIESWIIQSESIQTYWTSGSRANWIAYWKFFGSSDVGILSNMLSRSCSFNVKIGRKPQQ
jgi:hypothetical protein